MADIRLAIAVDAAGAITSVKQFNDEVGKTPAAAGKAGSALDRMKGIFSSFTSGIGAGGGFALAQKGLEAIGSALRTIGPDLFSAGQKASVAQHSFEALAGSIGLSSKAMLDQSRSATKGLITDLDIMSASNKALLLGLPVTAQGMATLSSAAVALGRAMGQDANKSLDDLIIGLGRGSPKILDNLGIVVKAEDAYQAYGAAIHKSVGEMTEADRTTAVYQSAIQSMASNVDRLGGIHLTLADRLQQVNVMWQNLYSTGAQAISQSESLNSAFGSLVTTLETGVGWIEDNKNAMVGFVEDGLSTAMDIMRGGKEVVVSFYDAFADISGLNLANSALSKLTGTTIGLLDVLKGVAKIGLSGLTSGMSTGLASLGSMVGKNDFMSYKDRMSKADSEAHWKLFGFGGSGSKADTGPDPFAPLTAARIAELKKMDDDAKKALEDRLKAEDEFFMNAAKNAEEFAKNTNAMNRMVEKALASGPLATQTNNLASAQMYLATRNATLGIGSDFAAGGSQGPKIAKLDPSSWFNHAGMDGYKVIEQPSMKFAQALQNLANIAQTSGSKLAKGLASIFGGGAGIGSGLSALFGSGKASFGTGLTAILGKAGMWGQIATSSISLFSGLFGLFKKKPKEPPPEPPKQATAQAWASFVGDQQSKGAAGVLAGVSGIKVTTPEDMAAQASIASQSFWAMFKEQGLIKAADAFKAVRDKMVETFKAAGADDSAIGAMIGPMSQVVDLAGNEAFRGAADGANGFAQALASIANQQLPMTVDQFHAFEQQAVAGYEQMKQAAIDQGMSLEEATKDAAIASGQYLTTLKDAATKYGFQLDGSKAIFEQATASGVAFGTSSEDRLIMSLDALTETLGGAPPKFEQALSTAATQAGDRIGQAGGGIRGDKALDITEDGVGTSVAESLNPGLEATADKIVAGLSQAFAAAVAAMPVPTIGDDAIASAAARAINSGSPALSTALAGRG